MSREILEQVVARAVGDAAFRQLLRTDPGAALREFRLSGEERAALTSGDPAKLVALGVDQRMSRALVVGGGDDWMKPHRDAGDTDISAAARQLDPNRTEFATLSRVAGEQGPAATEERIGAPPGEEFDASLIAPPAETAGQAHLRMVEEMLDVSATAVGDSLPADAMGTVEAGGILREGAPTRLGGIEGDLAGEAPSAIESELSGHAIEVGSVTAPDTVGGLYRLREGVEPVAGDATPAGAMGPVDTDAQQESMTNVEWSKPEALEEPPSEGDLTEY